MDAADTLLAGSRCPTIQILGIPFLRTSAADSVRLCLSGGLVVVPAGPALAGELLTDRAYREAVLTADFVLPDSGAMVLGWNLRNLVAPSRRLARLSGLSFLIALLRDLKARSQVKTFWVMPSEEDGRANLDWLRANGFPSLTDADCYVAPHYLASRDRGGRDVEDPVLVERLEMRHPDVVVVNIGGGTQEVLGAYLKRSLSWTPAIICTGAAIAFLSGCQAKIPPWADQLYLGWLFRIFREPSKFLPRYGRAFRLFGLIAVYGSRPPWESGAAERAAR